MNEVVADGVWMAGEGLSSEGEPERMRVASRADSIGRTYQDDSEHHPAGKRMRRRRGGANRLINCRRDPPGKGPRCANFYVAFGTFVGI